jgi:subtilisin family serine protease
MSVTSMACPHVSGAAALAWGGTAIRTMSPSGGCYPGQQMIWGTPGVIRSTGMGEWMPSRQPLRIRLEISFTIYE